MQWKLSRQESDAKRPRRPGHELGGKGCGRQTRMRALWATRKHTSQWRRALATVARACKCRPPLASEFARTRTAASWLARGHARAVTSSRAKAPRRRPSSSTRQASPSASAPTRWWPRFGPVPRATRALAGQQAGRPARSSRRPPRVACRGHDAARQTGDCDSGTAPLRIDISPLGPVWPPYTGASRLSQWLPVALGFASGPLRRLGGARSPCVPAEQGVLPRRPGEAAAKGAGPSGGSRGPGGAAKRPPIELLGPRERPPRRSQLGGAPPRTILSLERSARGPTRLAGGSNAHACGTTCSRNRGGAARQRCAGPIALPCARRP